MVSIYALVDPTEKHPVRRYRYVGRTSRPLKTRLAGHLWDVHRRQASDKQEWIRGLLRAGVAPEIVLLETVSPKHADQAERRQVVRLNNQGAPLTNLMDRKSLAFRRKLSEAAWSETARRKRAKTMKKIRASTAYRRKLSEGVRDSWRDPSTRRRHCAAAQASMKRRWRNPTSRRELLASRDLKSTF